MRFVLSSSGHVQALVNPATPDSRSSYQVTSDLDAERVASVQSAPQHPGSWWTDYTTWLDDRAGERRPAPADTRRRRAPGDREGTGNVRARRVNGLLKPKIAPRETRGAISLSGYGTGTAAGLCSKTLVRASSVISTFGVPYAKNVAGSSRPYIDPPSARFSTVHVRVSKSGSWIV